MIQFTYSFETDDKNMLCLYLALPHSPSQLQHSVLSISLLHSPCSTQSYLSLCCTHLTALICLSNLLWPFFRTLALCGCLLKTNNSSFFCCVLRTKLLKHSLSVTVFCQVPSSVNRRPSVDHLFPELFFMRTISALPLASTETVNNHKHKHYNTRNIMMKLIVGRKYSHTTKNTYDSISSMAGRKRLEKNVAYDSISSMAGRAEKVRLHIKYWLEERITEKVRHHIKYWLEERLTEKVRLHIK